MEKKVCRIIDLRIRRECQQKVIEGEDPQGHSNRQGIRISGMLFGP